MTAEARIARLSLRAPRASGAAVRHSAEQRLQGIDWHPSGMPPSGILLIRRLDDPLPGSFEVAGRGVGAPKRWREALRARLSALFDTALRPRTHRGTDLAEALYFESLADLLAFLACALAEQADGWWWPAARLSLAGHGVDTSRVHSASRPAELLQALPQYVPAVVSVLAAQGRLPVLLRAMDEAEARRLFRSLADVFALPREMTGAHSVILLAGPGARQHNASPTGAPPVPASAAPWREELLARGLADMGTAAQSALIGLALALHARPMSVRTSCVVRRARDAGQDVAQPAPREIAPTLGRPRGVVFPDAGQAEPEHRLISWLAEAPDPAAQDPEHTAAPHAGSPPTVSTRVAPSDPPPGVEADSAARATSALPTSAQGMAGAPYSAQPASTVSPEPAGPIRNDAQIVTRLGGIFYLIHCLDDLGIPADPALLWPLERAGAWGALHGIARSLLAQIGLQHDDDPIWTLFDTLEPPLPPVAFEPADIRAPTTWPRQLCDPAPCLRHAATQGRLWLWSEAGYLLADIRRNDRAQAAQARSEAARFAGSASLRRGRVRDAPLPPRLPLADPALGQAARAVTPAVRRRLCLALGCALDDTAALRDLLCVTATLCLGASHIDLIARLDQISLPARRAGLDRDPGWRPDLGRVLMFHFH